MKNSLVRCSWCEKDDQYRRYHDEEWGVPVANDAILFEFIVLESAQAGLSWWTVLKKRENYRKAFADFDVEKVALFSEHQVEKLMQNSGIIRNEAKIRASIGNAQAFIKTSEEYGSFGKYMWKFVDGKPLQNKWQRLSEVPPTTSVSDTFAKDLKARGFKFLGTTTIYAHMQAVGMVNDHLVSCPRYAEVQELAKIFHV